MYLLLDIYKKKKISLMSLCDVVKADLMECLFVATPKCIWRVVVERNSMPHCQMESLGGKWNYLLLGSSTEQPLKCGFISQWNVNACSRQMWLREMEHSVWPIMQAQSCSLGLSDRNAMKLKRGQYDIEWTEAKCNLALSCYHPSVRTASRINFRCALAHARHTYYTHFLPLAGIFQV